MPPRAVVLLGWPVVVVAVAAQEGTRLELDLAGAPRLQVAGDRNLDGELQQATVRDGVLDLRDPRAQVTFGPDSALGVSSAEAFTVEVELRTQRSEFGTIVMCREDGVVHYSFTIGRTPGCVAFEPWSWKRDKLLSAERLDDGAWHKVVGVHDHRAGLALFVDGELVAQQPASAAFAGSPSPSLRLGQNLDPGVRQPFGGEVRRFALRRGVPDGLVKDMLLVRQTALLPAAQRSAALSAWLAHQRRARPPVAASAEEWERTARRIRAGVQDAIGLWPPPYAGEVLGGRASPLSGDDAAVPTDFAALRPKLDLALRAGGTLQRERHTVTRLYWQTFADYFASGWLYLPHPAPTARVPAILCPHGHWKNGARHPVVQARCVALAQQGYVVLAVDSVHLFDDRIGLSPMSVMTWNNLRGLELLRARSDVDGSRIGCTGASGGAQQTYYLTALDCGLAVAAPAVMACHFEDILTERDVHCACNHTPHLVRAADMPQMAAAFAPRPQFFLTVTGDWTHRFHEHGFPAVRALYAQFGAGDAVSVQQWDKGHDYDQPMREAVYAFFARTLRHGSDAAPNEPEGGAPTEELEVLTALDRQDVPCDGAAVVAEFRARLQAPRARPAADVVRSLRALFEHDEEPVAGVPERGGDDLPLPHGQRAVCWTIPTDGELRLPALVLQSTAVGAEPAAPSPDAAPRVAVVLSDRGKADALTRHRERITALQRGGVTVIVADVRYAGELNLGAAWRDLYGRFFGLDEGVLAVRDVRRIVAALPALGFAGARVAVVGLGDHGAVALFAAALDERIDLAAAPRLGPNYRDAERRPLVSRILLHGDLDDARELLGARALTDAAATPAAIVSALGR